LTEIKRFLFIALAIRGLAMEEIFLPLLLKITGTVTDLLKKKSIKPIELVPLQSLISDLQNSITGQFAKITELQSKVLDLSDKYNAVKAENEEYKDWSKKQESHFLKKLYPGILVFVPKDTKHEFGETPYWACPRCFNNRKIQFIQYIKDVVGHKVYNCPECNMELRIPTGVRISSNHGLGGKRTSW
jgi:rubrerythrin